MSTALVTIGIPCYNAIDSVFDAIQAALSQDYPAVEVIVCDDGSTDGTREKLAQWSQELGFRLVLMEKNGGVAKVCNTILQHARGDYVAFCGDDDMFVKHRISEQMKQLAPYAAEELVCSFVARTQLFETGAKVYEPAVFRADGLPITPEELLRWSVLGRYGSSISGSAGSGVCLAHRRVYEALGGYDERFRRSSDMEFVLRLALMNGRVVTLQESLLIQRMTAGADKTSEKQRQYFEMMLEKHKLALIERGFYRPAKLFSAVKFAFLRKDWWTVMTALAQLALWEPRSLARSLKVAYQRRRTIRDRQRLIQSAI